MTRFVYLLLAVLLASPAFGQQVEQFPRLRRTYPVPAVQPVAPRATQPVCPTCVPSTVPATIPAVVKPAPAVEPSKAPVADPFEPINAAEAPQRDVPPVALHEVMRRGTMVQELGTAGAGEIDAVGDALAIPPDDSFKWFITLVTMEGCRPCEKLKYDFINSKELQAWVLVDDPVQSACHYQVRRYEDSTQRDWLAGIDQELRRGGFPAIVIQPPRNGQYGANKTVVSVLHGYDGNPKKLSDKMTAAITRYVSTLHRRGEIRGSDARANQVIGGYGQSKEENNISGPPPFVVPPKPVDPVQPVGPVPTDWPTPPTPPSPAVLTLDQIKEIAPKAPADFLLAQLNAKVADANVVKLSWEVYKKDHGIKDDPAPNSPAVPSTPGVGFWTALGLFFLAGLPGLLSLILHTFRGFVVSSGRTPLLTEEQFAQLLDFIAKLPTISPTKPA